MLIGHRRKHNNHTKAGVKNKLRPPLKQITNFPTITGQ